MVTPDIKESVRWKEGYGIIADMAERVPGSKAIWEGMEKVRHYAVGIEVGKAVYVEFDSSCR